MRYHARVLNHGEVKRLMARVTEGDACLLYLYDSEYDTCCIADYWFENLEQAFDYSNTVYGVQRMNWAVIGATEPHCQDDWITPTRIPGRDTGSPVWGRLEQLVNGQWSELNMQALPKIEIDYSSHKPFEEER